MISRDSTPEAQKRFTDDFMKAFNERNAGQPEFQQAVGEFVETLAPFVLDRREYLDAKILERITEPDRLVLFRVTWQDDAGRPQVNRAWRVQFSNAIGPYKGGMRFHPSVNSSILKFLGFEQVFKNSLTGLPMGGAKGGSDFDPKGRSDSEVMRFCQSLMLELQRYIGEDVDVPAGDIGVGHREISYMFGQYKRLHNRFAGILTGKGLSFGGSLIRKEATGYGCVYFMQRMLETKGAEVAGKTCAVSGSGNVALYAIEKLIELGAKPVTASDSGGFVHDPDGIDKEKLEWLKDLKEVRRGRIREYAGRFPRATYYAGCTPWNVKVDLAFPCATQNEISAGDAKALVANGLAAMAEGANMPCSAEATRLFLHAKIPVGTAKAANAGGVAVSGLEQSQNALRISWKAEEVDQRLQAIMTNIHARAAQFGYEPDGYINYVRGANIGGFVKVAEAMLAYGIV
jgi:glutamate dehydrogenase (NADP+)